MAFEKAFNAMEYGNWEAVKEILSKGQLSKADCDKQEGVKYLSFISVLL